MSRYEMSSATVTRSSPASTTPATYEPQGQVLRGRYLEPLRSSKGKIKGLMLHAPDGVMPVKLPKYLRPMLVREVMPGSWVQVWAFPKDEHWRGINLIPWPESEVPSEVKAALAVLQTSALAQSASPTEMRVAPVCIQVCRKGKCFKQGGYQIWSALQAEIDANPGLQHVTIEATGCMNACKQGPNLRVLPHGKMHSRVTPGRALSLLADCQ